MFNLISKRLVIHKPNYAVGSSNHQALSSIIGIGIGIALLDFPQNSRLSLFSTNAEQDSFTINYLTNTLGFSRKDAIRKSKYLNLKTRDKPDAVLALFENNGIPKTQIMQFVKSAPAVLLFDPVKTLIPKIAFFQSIGISGADLGALLTSYCTPFRCSLDNQIIPCFNYISDLLESQEEAVGVVKRYPAILSRNVRTQVEPYVDILRDNGVSVSNIIMFLRFLPDFRTIKMDKFKKDIKSVKEMGISPLKSQFIVAIIGMRPMNKTKWQTKVDVYKKWGFTDEEIVASFVKLPWFMVNSEDKINSGMDFFVNKMGWGPSVIAKRPKLLSLSLKKRLIPRGEVFRFLTSNGVLKKEHSNLPTYIEYSEKRFKQSFLESYEEAPELLKLYEEKMSSF